MCLNPSRGGWDPAINLLSYGTGRQNLYFPTFSVICMKYWLFFSRVQYISLYMSKIPEILGSDGGDCE